MTRAGTPAAMTLSGSGFVTTAPAATMVPLPTSASTIAPVPIQRRADRDHAPFATLFAYWPGRIVEVVRLSSGRNLHIGREQHVAFEVNQTELAARANIDVFVENGVHLREERSELNQGR